MTKTIAETAWETIEDLGYSCVERMPVPGGWLYTVNQSLGTPESWTSTTTFVPHPPAALVYSPPEVKP